MSKTKIQSFNFVKVKLKIKFHTNVFSVYDHVSLYQGREWIIFFLSTGKKTTTVQFNWKFWYNLIMIFFFFFFF
jgi:hypothetical protein